MDRPRWRPSLRAQLLILVTLVTLPFIVLIAADIYEEVGEARRSAADTLERLAEYTAADTAAALQRTERALRALLAQGDITRADARACARLEEALLFLGPGFTNMILSDGNGRILCTVRKTNASDLPRHLRDGVLTASGATFIGPVEPGFVSGLWAVPVLVRKQGPLDGTGMLLGTSLDLSIFHPFIAGIRLPEGAEVAIVDRQGKLVAQAIDGSRNIGHRVFDAEWLRAATRAGSEGIDLGERLAVALPISGTEWIAVASRPRGFVESAWQQAAWRSGLVALMVLLGVAYLAYRLTTAIDRPVRVLARVARGVAGGAPDRRVPSLGSRELENVGEEINHMLDTLQATSERLRLSEARFRALTALSSDWYWRLDAQFRFAEFSGALGRGGVDRDSRLGKCPWDIAGSQPVGVTWNDIRQRFERHETMIDADHEYRRADGGTFWLRVSAQPIYDSAGAFAGYQGVTRDITAEVLAERKIREKEKRYRDLFYRTPAIKLLIDVEADRIVEINQAAADFYGYSRPAMVGQPWSKFRCAPLDAAALPERQALRTHYETTHVLADGSQRAVEVHAGPIEVDGRMMRLEIVHDITERAAGERELRRLAQAMEQSVLSIIMTDAEGRIEYVNARFSDVTGYTKAEVIGRKPSLLKSGETSHDEYEHLWRVISHGGVWHGEFQNRRKDGSHYRECARIEALRETDGRISGYFAVSEIVSPGAGAGVERPRASPAVSSESAR